MTDTRPKKRARHDAEQLVALHRGPYVSERALAAVLKNIRDNGLPNATSRAPQYRAREAIIADETTPYGHLLQQVDMPLPNGKVFKSWVGAPAPMLYSCAKRSSQFRALLRRQLGRHPCSLRTPWRICFYFDGISPRDPLAKGKDYRGVDAFYWSFLDLDEYLQDEDSWLCVSAARVAMIRSMEGGVSHHASILLNEFFFNSDRFHFTNHGVTLDLSEEGDGSSYATIVAKLECTIGDEEALRELHMNKGHSGTKPCAICRNVVDSKFDYASHDASGMYVESTCLDKTKWVRNTDAAVVKVLERLAPHWQRYRDGNLSKEGLRAVTQRAGWNYSPKNIILNESLNYKVMSLLCFDWMHVWCVSGVFDREVDAVLKQPRPVLFSCADLHRYVSEWSFPHKFVDASRVFETGDFQASASQELSVAPILAKYIRDVIASQANDVMPDQIQSFLLCCDALEMVVGSARGVCGYREYEDSVFESLAAHFKAYGKSYWAYKHHMAAHLPEMFEKFGPLACFVHERKHKTVKKFSKDHLSKRCTEKALMTQLIAQHSHDIQTFSFCVGLHDPISASNKLLETLKELRPGTQTARSSTSAYNENGVVWRGDIVLLGTAHNHSAGQVWFHVECDPDTPDASGAMTIMTVFQPRHIDPHGRYSKYVFDDDAMPQLVPTSSVKCAVTYKRSGRTLVALWPIEYKRNYSLA